MAERDNERHVAFARHRFDLPVEKAQVEADWNVRGYSCDWMMDSTGREWRDCTHRSNALLAVVDGELEIIVSGQKFTLGPGDELGLPKGSLHHLRNASGGTTRWLYGFDVAQDPG
jgi:mannose-6-phosphate isomerase-like protein (cupin superfamily)